MTERRRLRLLDEPPARSSAIAGGLVGASSGAARVRPGAGAGLERVPAEPRPEPLHMLDLFSGSGSASRAAAVRGWSVTRIDNAIEAAADVRADLATWKPPHGFPRVDLLWASPPCTAFSSVNQSTRDVASGLVLVRATLRLIESIKPRWWVLENVHGATRAIATLLGPPVARYGSFYLWGVFPPFEADVARDKTRKSGRRRAERRAAIPWAISDSLVRACEALARELGQ